MPELPEVESVRRQLEPVLAGRRVTDVWTDPHPRVPRQFVDAHRAVARTVVTLRRRGKFLIASLDDDLELVLHLGMTGELGVGLDDGHVRARLTLDDGRVVGFRDPRRFGRLAVVRAGSYESMPTLARLGPEPLSPEFDPAAFVASLATTRAPVKAVLLGQRVVAGVGNIYADEALWAARIHPASRRVGRARALVLHREIRRVLEEAIAHEGTTFRNYRKPDGSVGRNASRLVAYGRAGAPCPRCGGPLAKRMLAGRGTTYCPRCQRA